MRTKENRKIGLIVGLLTTVFMSAQDICVKRVSRYSEAPSVVTIYRSVSLPLIKDYCDVECIVAILVDSVYVSEKFYNLTCSFSQPIKNPLFVIKTITGETSLIFPSYLSEDGLYIEAALSDEELYLFKFNKISGIGVQHKDLLLSRVSRVACNTYFSEFINKY